MTTPTSTKSSELPATIGDFLTARAASDVSTAIRAFSPTAVVVDDGQTFRGTDEILRFLSKAGSEYTYTTELTGVRRTGDDGGTARHRLVGDFPGRVVDLDYRFTMNGDFIAELVIVPSTS